jgi:hypothetical protein
MNWLQQNRFLGTFLGAFGLATLLGLWFLFHEKGAADAAQARLEETLNELSRLRRSTPFPEEENLKKTRAQTETYRASLLALEKELKNRMFPRLPLQPNEFQAQLRLAVNDVLDHAATAKVQLPANFNLGFDPYATSLPNLEAAPRLGRQLRAIEWIVNTIIDAHVDSLGSLAREPLAEEKAASETTPTPGRGVGQKKAASGREKIVDGAPIDLSFSGSPAAVRRVINQIAAARDQFYIIRTLVVKNQVDKGPKRGGPETTAPAPAPPPGAPAAGGKEPGISFIVGTEHLDVAARVEIMRFNFAEKEAR